MTQEVCIPGSAVGAEEDTVSLPEYDPDEVSKVVYPQTTEDMTEDEFVSRSVKGRYNYIGWLLLAALGFGLSLAACSVIVGMLVK